jgi:hypothetical protein
MAEFDYDAAAELFSTRRGLPRRQPFGYKRFARAALAIRFAMENLPEGSLVGAFLEVDEQRYGSQDIRRLYESPEYPLTRTVQDHDRQDDRPRPASWDGGSKGHRPSAAPGERGSQ